MRQEELIRSLKKRLKQLKENDFYDYFPNMIEDIEYFYNNLEQEIESLSEEEQIDCNYEIHELLITYWMELLKNYLKETLKQTINYEFDELLSIGGCAAYDEEKDRILLSVIGLMIQEINLMSYVQPSLHEFRHKLQHDYYKEEQIENILSYPDYFLLIEKHYLYRKYHKSDSFYLDNYTYQYPEIDAEEYSSNIIKQILPTLYQKYKKQKGTNKELEERVYLLQERIKNDVKEIRENLEERKRINTPITKELYDKKEITTFFQEENQLRDSIVEVDTFLKNHLELQEDYPILKLLWNDHSPKKYQEILLDQNNLLEIIPNQEIIVFGKKATTHKQIKKLYERIIQSDPILQIEEWIETNQIEKIEKYLKIHPTILERYPEDRERLLSHKQKIKSLA